MFYFISSLILLFAKKFFMKTILVLLFVFSFSLSSVIAQSSTGNSSGYTTAVGIKFYPTGLNVKHFTSDKIALEGLAYFYNEGERITGLYEIHNTINNAGGLKWYFGPGAHVTFYNTKHGGFTSVGIDGVIGLDYKINSTPINLSLDYQPSIQLTNYYGDRFSSWGGFAIRYTLN